MPDSPLELSTHTTPPQRSHLGLLFLGGVVCIWVAASYLVSALESSSDPRHAAAIHPFVLTYICNSLFVLWLPFASTGKLYLPHPTPRSPREDDDAPLLHLPPSVQALPLWRRMSPVLRSHAAAAALLCPLWFGGQLCFNLSLSLTSVAANTVLSAPASLVVFLLSLWLLDERFRWRTLISVGACVVGTLMVTFADAGGGGDGQGSAPLLGDCLTVLSTVLYAFYTVGIKKLLPEDSDSSMALFFGLIGIGNLFLFGPVLLLLQATGAVDVWATTWSAFGWALVKGLFDNALSDYMWARAVLLLGPTVASTGLTMQVPVVLAIDIYAAKADWVQQLSTAAPMVAGAAFVLLGFYALNT